MIKTCPRLKCCKITIISSEGHGKFWVSYGKIFQESYQEILLDLT